MSPGVEASMSNTVGKADRTGYHLKALQEIRNSLKPFATENGSPLPTLQKDGNLSYQQQLYHPYPIQPGYVEVIHPYSNSLNPFQILTAAISSTPIISPNLSICFAIFGGCITCSKLNDNKVIISACLIMLRSSSDPSVLNPKLK